jgi:oligopeptide/dipeptide ABC transporter ATP-binding protein
VTALSVLRLIPWPPGKIVNGQIIFKGRDILGLSENDMQKIRGTEITMIFQEPSTSLNPVYTIGHQIAETYVLHNTIKGKEARERTMEVLEMVGISDPKKIFNQYPYELSGGMQQRVMIAIALACNPDLLIADEPTTALDVTIQAQILELMHDLQKRLGTTILLITHDLGVVAEFCNRVAVMHAGVIVEKGNVHSIFKYPHHPYTQGLMRTIPRIDEYQTTLLEIEGEVPSVINPPKGCRFHPRCPNVMDICRRERPDEYFVEDNHAVSCFLYS